MLCSEAFSIHTDASQGLSGPGGGPGRRPRHAKGPSLAHATRWRRQAGADSAAAAAAARRAHVYMGPTTTKRRMACARASPAGPAAHYNLRAL